MDFNDFFDTLTKHKKSAPAWNQHNEEDMTQQELLEELEYQLIDLRKRVFKLRRELGVARND